MHRHDGNMAMKVSVRGPIVGVDLEARKEYFL